MIKGEGRISGNGNWYFNSERVRINVLESRSGWSAIVTHFTTGIQRKTGTYRAEDAAKVAALALAEQMAATLPPPRFSLREIAEAAPTAPVTFSFDELEHYGLADYCVPCCRCRAKFRLVILECRNDALQLRLQCLHCERLCPGVVRHDAVEPAWITRGVAVSKAKTST